MNRALLLASSLRRVGGGGGGGGRSGSSAPSPDIERVAFQSATIRSGSVAVARISGSNLDAGVVRCEVLSPGYILDVLPEQTVQKGGSELVVAMRVFRRVGTPRPLCLVRISIGSATAVGSITVRV